MRITLVCGIFDEAAIAKVAVQNFSVFNFISRTNIHESQRKGSPIAGLERIERVSSGPVQKDETHGKIPNQSED
ncbi:MAG: hypothetical protein WBC85_02670, partial [Planktotalea sp.]|uniref:hypothetical protein n=1 Tax=Planktotalea sp. TaxID=2029877 RepID=UPI003C76BE79